MASAGPHAQPSHVIAEGGQVLLEGPEGVAIGMTPEAAEETARRILIAVEEIREKTSVA
jgi:hypothetical protein